MIKIQKALEEYVMQDEIALSSMNLGYMNYSKYAALIKKKMEKIALKKIETQSLVVSLSRLSKKVKTSNSIIKDVEIRNITTKSPLSEIVYGSDKATVNTINAFYNKLKLSDEEFYTSTSTSSELTIICSPRIADKLSDHVKDLPIMRINNLAAILLSIDPKYYPKPNITYSLIRRIALKQIPLAETITTRSNIIFVFDIKYLKSIVELFV